VVKTGLKVLILAAALCLAGAAQARQPAADKPADCRVGLYHLDSGLDIDVAPSNGATLRWRAKDGRTGLLTQSADGQWSSTLGWTGRDDGKRVSFGPCAEGTIVFDGTKGRQVQFDVIETRFQGAGVTLAGRLVLPRGRGPVPIVVLVHGSEDSSARDFYALQRQFPSEGIGAFVYDKRGTGGSGGRYTQNYLLLANDAIAAAAEARRLAGSRAGRVGYQAGSQGGWVAPLAAKIAPVDFVIVGFGLAVSPLEENRAALALDMTRRGYGPDVVAKAMEFADATDTILLSNFREGYEAFEAVRAKYAKEPWFPFIHGNVTFFLLEKTPAELKDLGPRLLEGTPMTYDPMPVLRNLATPQLWILGADDIDAPSAETIVRLRALAADGRPIVTAVFPRAEHGIYEYETAPDGSRLSTRSPDGYFRMMRDFILTGRLAPAYGSAVLYVPERK
jgi:pimeloyl-ACP methyl ester carboxylesterase